MARVLVAEDYPPLAKVIAIAIQRDGHEVERVGSVARALSVTGGFDLAIVDLDLPDGFGTEVAEQLNREHRLGSVIFFTSTRDDELRSAAELLGRVVHKESGIDELMVWVRRELDQRQRLAQAVGAETRPSRGLVNRSGTHKRFGK